MSDQPLQGQKAIVTGASSGIGEAMAIQADVAKEDQVKAMFQEMFKAWETVDILVNNAGLQRDAPFVDMTIEQWNSSWA